MIITIVSDAATWFNAYVPPFLEDLRRAGHTAEHIHHVKDIPPSEVVFYLSCAQLVPPAILARNRHNIVIHGSDLPRGKGWSPITWQITEGKNEIPMTMFEAVEAVDSGRIYLRDALRFAGHELVGELREQQALVSIRMCHEFLRRYPAIIDSAEEQRGDETFYPRRKREQSRLDPDKTLREQFNLLRVVDNERYPAFFEINGRTYKLMIEHDEHREQA
jgi:methionyl-tRNA formyltransferase